MLGRSLRIAPFYLRSLTAVFECRESRDELVQLASPSKHSKEIRESREEPAI